ncbi:MAG: dihydroorotase [Candidatus Mcinerneyibacterium aminivorans]|uniref:Dihydroorotase n=1 Tax=Candidatus Mcinerneyibacterium aminivorans TaxID=2703815 RepID=A0A5D0MD08_9BACT|nr:MAG: dihydroorotase [Candidatus Mcinerneyibacterium aminivorans]
MKYLLKKAKIVNYDKKPYKGDILIEGNEIKKVGNLNEEIIKPNTVIDLEGLHVFPGIIDMHSHLREPGGYIDINIKTQTEAAVKSGITTVVAMPNTNPVCDKLDIYDRIKQIIKKKAACDVIQVMAGTMDIEGEIITEFDSAGTVKAVSDDGRSVENSRILLNVLKKVKKKNIVYLSHAEDDNLRKDGVINSGKKSNKFDLKPIYNEVEDIRTYRDLSLASIAGSRIHFCHLSTEESLNLVKRFKERNVNVTCEVTPHHLFLSESDIKENIGIYKMNPPLRSDKDRQALIKGIKEGSIDAIATDHAPHPMKNKLKDFNESSFGIIGFETLIPLAIEKLYYKEDIPLQRLAELLSYNPSKILNLDRRGRIEKNALAYLTVVDINDKIEINKSFIKSKTYNTPFLNSKLRGKPLFTVINGKIFDIEKDSWYENK